MNKQAQISIGAILVVFVTILVGVVLFQTIAQQVGTVTSTVAVANQSETLAANGASIYIEEYRALSSVVILNASDNVTIAAGNYTVTNNAINPTTGALSVQVTTDDAEFASNAVRVSGTAEPLTYVSNSGGRAVAGLISIFFALAVAVVALTPTLRSGILNAMGR
jgi:hypothetical protein